MESNKTKIKVCGLKHPFEVSVLLIMEPSGME